MKLETFYFLAELVLVVAAILSFAIHDSGAATFFMAFAIFNRINRGESK